MLGNIFLDFLNHWSSTICAIIIEYLVDLLFNIDPPIIESKSLHYLILQIFIICPIFSQYSTKIIIIGKNMKLSINLPNECITAKNTLSNAKREI